MKDPKLQRQLLIKEIEIFGNKIFRVDVYEELSLSRDPATNEIAYSDDDLVELRDRLRDILRTVGGK